ncbi:hypothetical protein ScPMuIL_015777 [Solemya velum]
MKSGNCLQIVRSNLLVILTLAGAVVGFAVGLSVRTTHPSFNVLMWLGILGEIYLRMLKMMILPLIVASVIAGAASMDPKSNGRISAISFGYIIVTNSVPCVIGTVLCLVIQPGVGLQSTALANDRPTSPMETQDIFADLLRNLFPDNIVTACFEQVQTTYPTTDVLESISTTNWTNTTQGIRELNYKRLGTVGSTNILGLIIACSIFGIATSAVKEVGRPFRMFFSSACEIILRILRWLIWTTPVGVASLIAKTMASTDDIEDTFRKLGLYFLTVMLGLAFITIVVVPAFYFAVMRKNPFWFLLSFMESIMIVFATSSTAIAIPETLYSLEEKNAVDKRVTRFVVPFSAALGRAGSTTYISISCIFIMQLVGLEIDAGQVILVIVLTVMSAYAIPSVTGASLVTVIILLSSLNMPTEAASLLYALEWFLDRARSVTNICVQTLGSVFTHELCKNSLSALDNTEMDIMKDDFGLIPDISLVPTENCDVAATSANKPNGTNNHEAITRM